MISATNSSCQEYDGVLNINVFIQGAGKTLSTDNDVSHCVEEMKKSAAPNNRIKLEYFNIDRTQESREKCTTPYKDTNITFCNINKNYKGITRTAQLPNKYEKIGHTNSLRNDVSKNEKQGHSKVISCNDIEASEKTAKVGVFESNASTETQNRKISNQQPAPQVRKANYSQLIGNPAYLNKSDREQKGDSSRYVYFGKFMNVSESIKKSSKRTVSNHLLQRNVKAGFELSTCESPKMLGQSTNLAKPNDNIVRSFGKPFYSRKLPMSIKNVDRSINMKGHGNFSHFTESFQGMDTSDHRKRGEQQSKEDSALYQRKPIEIIKPPKSTSNTTVNEKKETFKPSHLGSNGLKPGRRLMAGKRGDGDNLKSDSTNLGVKILLPLEKNVSYTAEPRTRKSIKNFKLQKQLKEKLGSASRKKVQSVQYQQQQLYYNFLFPENNFIEKCFLGGKTQYVTPPKNQPPVENEQLRNTTCGHTTDTSHLNQDFSSESTTRVEFMSAQKKTRKRNQKSRGSHYGELGKNKAYPGNIVKMRTDETPCEYLNQFSSILIDNLKDPVPKDPHNLPSACNVYVPMRKRPIPLEQYAEHSIKTVTSSVTVNTTMLSGTSDTSSSNSQSVGTSKSIIILKKISELTKNSGDKNKNEKPKEKRKNNKRLHRQSNQSVVEKPCCCFIQ